MDNFKAQEPSDSKLHFLDYWRIIRIRKTVIIAVFLLVVITTTVVTYMLPPKYMSWTRIKVEKDSADVPLLGQMASQGPPDMFFLQTEFEVIQSKTNLYKVIDDLSLNQRWSKEFMNQGTLKTVETYEILKDRIDVRQFRNTTMIEIRVYSKNKAEAAEIANKIAAVYRESRLAERENAASRGIDKIVDSIKDQQGKVQEKQKALDELREKYQITDLMMDSYSQGNLETDNVRQLYIMRADAEARRVRFQASLDKLQSLTPEELRNTLPTLYKDDAQLMEQLTKSSELGQNMVRMRATMAENNPDVMAVRSVMDQVERDLQARIKGIMNSLSVQVGGARDEVAAFDKEIDKARNNDLVRGKQYREYFEKKRETENIRTMLDVLNRKLIAERFDSQIPRTALVQITDIAEEGLNPVKPNIPLNIAFGVVVGLVVGIGLAFFIEYLDTSVKTIDDVERSLGAPVVGVIPQNVGSLLDEGPDSPHAEAYRVLRTNVLFTRKDETFNTITIVSGGAGEGKSTTLFNLAVVFAQNGNRVLIVDSDLRRPSMHKFLKVSNSQGLTNVLLGQNKLEEVVQTSSLPTLDFLPSGRLPSSSMGILSSQQMKDLIADVKRRYDFVFFDSPPIMGVSDAVVLASEVDISLQVIQYRKYPQAMTLRAKQMVSKVGGYLVGIVLNNINMSQDENYYYYSGYYYDYYQSRDKESGGDSKPEDGKSKNGSTELSRIDLKKKY